MDQSSSCSLGCLKIGCTGCLTLFALILGLVFLTGALQMAFEPGEPNPATERFVHELPGPPEPPEPPEPPGSLEASGVLGVVSEDRAALPEVLPLPGATAPPRGRVVLDLTVGNFVIQPGPEDQSIHVEADYDQANFELVESFEEVDGEWIYRLEFGSRKGFLGLLFGKESDSRIVLTIPKGHPVDILGEIGVGETEADFGGLSLRNLDLDLGVGEHFFEFREPLPEPMDSFFLNSSIGELEVRRLGDASPREVEVQHNIGEMLVDLQGDWQRDAEVELRFNIGDAQVWLPEETRTRVERARINIGDHRVDQPAVEADSEEAPTVTLSVEGNIGEVKVD